MTFPPGRRPRLAEGQGDGRGVQGAGEDALLQQQPVPVVQPPAAPRPSNRRTAPRDLLVLQARVRWLPHGCN